MILRRSPAKLAHAIAFKRLCGPSRLLLLCATAPAILAVQKAPPLTRVQSSTNGVHTSQEGQMPSLQDGPRNVLGTPLGCCCTSPVTGYYRDGFCRTDESDQGRHVICAQVTQAFLEFSKARGNDLMTPAPWFNFPGLKDGDKWCLCASRWSEALQAGVAPPVFLKCTHVKALEYVTLEQLKAHALDLNDVEL